MNISLMIFQGIEIPASTWGTLVFTFIVLGVGFVLGAFGGMYSECSGIINIALDGSMLLGAFSGILVCQQITDAMKGSPLLDNWWFANLIYFIGLLVCIVMAFLFSFLLSFASIKFKADQTIVGTALNSLVAAGVLIVNTIHRGADLPETDVSMFFNTMTMKWPQGYAFFNGMLSNINICIPIGIILIFVLAFIMNKTKLGLRIRACGENPAAADSVGIKVNKMRYIGTAIGSISAAIGGYTIFSCLRLSEWNLTSGVFGYGFLVLAIEILGNWKAKNITFAALFFALFSSLGTFMTTVFSELPKAFYNSKAFYSMLPYLLAILSLIFFSKKSHAPKAEGIPYDKSSR